LPRDEIFRQPKGKKKIIKKTNRISRTIDVKLLRRSKLLRKETQKHIFNNVNYFRPLTKSYKNGSLRKEGQIQTFFTKKIFGRLFIFVSFSVPTKIILQGTKSDVYE